MVLWRRPSGEGFIYAFIIIVIAILLLAFWGWFTGRWEADSQERLYQGVPLDAHLLALDKKALEVAYQEHVKLLFSVWLKDDISIVHRINTGLRRGREAYVQAAAKIEEREKALKSSP